MIKTPEIAVLHLSLIDGVGAVTIGKIIRAIVSIDRWYESIYTWNASLWMQHTFVSTTIANAIVKGLANQQLVEHELMLIEKNAISWTTVLSADFPPLLKAIHVPPAVLYYKGGTAVLHQTRAIAVVGSRDADYYGKRITKQLVRDLVARNWIVVSGGAKGIDTYSHQEALDSGGKTIVVLGSGLLKPYPHINVGLFEKIVNNGGVIASTFSLQTGALPGNFPARNRVISGLSRGCIVVQAAIKSGACITAYHALEQGRDVFAVPGHIDDPLSHGCHALIQSGAKLITHIDDVEEELALVEEPSQQISAIVPDKGKKSQKKQGEKIPPSLTEVEQKILDACETITSTDLLVEVTRNSLSDVQEALFNLQLENLIKGVGAGLWIRT